MAMAEAARCGGDLICWFDVHEGAGGWLGAFAGVFAGVAALWIAYSADWRAQRQKTTAFKYALGAAERSLRSVLANAPALQQPALIKRQLLVGIDVASERIAYALELGVTDVDLLQKVMSAQSVMRMLRTEIEQALEPEFATPDFNGIAPMMEDAITKAWGPALRPAANPAILAPCPPPEPTPPPASPPSNG